MITKQWKALEKLAKRWDKLTPYEQRIEVAECANWERGPKEDIRIGGLGIIAAKNKCWHPKDSENEWQDDPPDFINDLNAIYEAVNELSEREYNIWCDILWNLCENACGKTGAINATAAQRSKALVLTFGRNKKEDE